MIDLFIDESGNTGSIISKEGKFNYIEQKYFILGAVVVRTKKERKKLEKKYMEFLAKYAKNGELKGSTLLTKDYNSALQYFIDNILNRNNFRICIYDKDFYIATLLLVTILGYEFKQVFPKYFYIFASELVESDQSALVSYCEFSQNPNQDTFIDLMNVLSKFELRELSNKDNPIMEIAKKNLINGDYKNWTDGLLGYGSYSNNKYANLINLNCLAELYYTIKDEYQETNNDITVFHDNIDGYDKVLQNEMIKIGVNVNFIPSDDSAFIQVADNFVSVFGKLCKDSIKSYKANKNHFGKDEWSHEMLSKVMNKIDFKNIKFTVPMQDWSYLLSVMELFDTSKFPKQSRNNIAFNQLYVKYMNHIHDSFDENNKSDEEVFRQLNK
ncbi:DUF3800 domain-containing protein [Erysipelothrix anatis]|uniref:DUF3800 domain-containing protein n=1 Tax=Erysipelothrix anatis TaxID=2683713 RepID=UPI0014080764|nr:DUF3800 domain-containing protein [Erysipelothrix anatis]